MSRPSTLSPPQVEIDTYIHKALRRRGLEPRTIGTTDYPDRLPLWEARNIIGHSYGGVVLGFEQTRILTGVSKPGTTHEEPISSSVPLPTPWNQLEAGIMVQLDLPLLIFRESGVEGGIFDLGVTDAFIHLMPVPGRREDRAFKQILDRFTDRVRQRYYPA